MPPAQVHNIHYHHCTVCYIKTEDPDLPAFYYDPIINPISISRAGARPVDLDIDDDDEFELPAHVAPIMDENDLFTVSAPPRHAQRLGPESIHVI